MEELKENEQKIDEKYIKEAQFLGRGSEVLPGGIKELAQKLQKAAESGKSLRVKLGLDPTRADLHLGHSVVMKKLRQFQKAGHHVILLIGGATAMIGDPSGKSETRPSLSREDVDENAKTYLKQMGKVVDINKAEIVNNADWLSSMQLADLLKLSSNVTVAQMMVREDFSNRYNEGKPISIHEFFYPLMQAYDSVEIDADIELGGTDQRFNVLLGRDIQSAYGNKDPQMVMLLPLLEGTDGVVKMSKSYPENCISLTEEPKNMYGKLMSIPDSLIVKYFELLTDISDEELQKCKADIECGQINPRDYKMKLAKMIVSEYHNEEAGENAEQEFINIFQKKGVPDDVPEVNATEGLMLTALIAENDLAKSRGDAKRLIQGGGVKLDNEKVSDINYTIDFGSKDSMILQVGKRKFVKLIK